jgi:hypothetical protein
MPTTVVSSARMPTATEVPEKYGRQQLMIFWGNSRKNSSRRKIQEKDTKRVKVAQYNHTSQQKPYPSVI